MKLPSALIPLLLLTFACSTAAPDRAVRTSQTLKTLEDQATTARGHIDPTLTALDALMSASPEGLRAAYDQYDKELTALEKSAGAIRKSNDELHDRTADYFGNWKQDASKVSNPELQAIAEQRRQVVRDEYNKFKLTYAAVSTDFEALLKDLRDVRAVMGNDLTAATQNKVRETSVVTNARADGNRVQASIDTAVSGAKQLDALLSPAAQ
jgi:hypothetical protein